MPTNGDIAYLDNVFVGPMPATMTPEVQQARLLGTITYAGTANCIWQNTTATSWQYFAAVLPSKTVGVAGDERIYKYTVVVRAVRSLDGMTANFSHVPPDVLSAISTRITNEVRGVGRVVYDITNKPPSTIEME